MANLRQQQSNMQRPHAPLSRCVIKWHDLSASPSCKSFDAVASHQVALRFHTSRQRHALRTYMLHKMDLVDESQSSQFTLLCTWLTQEYLSSLVEADDQVNIAPFSYYSPSVLTCQYFFVSHRIYARSSKNFCLYSVGIWTETSHIN